ncbi:uncharacterized protein LOC119078539 [Bradysia coprophila]|uniref:uncharacterized protein LOC119078539 n=1 Tax=Bradysia coprophila TaxID=38358 RepID=UPI00187D9507|nr:uncharacterized protein LOC119078539 [Bradysia coprophila]
MTMWNSSNVDTSTRSQFEISVTALKKFYGINEVYIEGALDAIVTGCVKEYSFTENDMKFGGIVTSFDGNESYEVKIYVTDDYEIESVSCSCPDEICHHIGALALHSGFKTPLFSYLPQKRTVDGTRCTNTVADESDEKGIEFVRIKSREDFMVESDATDIDRNPKQNAQPKSRVKLITTIYICRICDKMCADAHQLQMHEAEEHNAAVDEIRITAFICRICRKMFLHSFQLHVHQAEEHTVGFDTIPASESSLVGSQVRERFETTLSDWVSELNGDFQ